MKMNDLDDFIGRISQKYPKNQDLPPDLAQNCNLRAKVDIDCNVSFSYCHLYDSKRHRCILE